MQRDLFHLIQISDLHITSEEFVPANKHVLRIPFLEGLNAHDLNVLRDLKQFIRKYRIRFPNTSLIMTGDLTANGSLEEFEFAKTFLFTQKNEFPSISIDYNLWPMGSIPGNHDHWAGNHANWHRLSTDAKSDVFYNVPFYDALWHLDDKRYIRFIGIDTDVDTNRVNRLLARGSFSTQLTRVSQQLKQLDLTLDPMKRDREIRVLLLHHPFSPSLKRPKRFIRKIDMATSRQLQAFIHEHRISVLCSGHLHIPTVQSVDVVHNGKTRAVLEAICGTSAQYTRDQKNTDHRWNTNAGALSKNTVLIHRVFEEGGQLKWAVETLIYVGPPTYFKPVVQDRDVAEQKMLAGELKIEP